MRHAGSFEDGNKSGQGQEADTTASWPTPLTLVAGAVAGDDLASVATTVAAALSRPVVIAIPALGAPVISPAESVDDAAGREIADHARAVIAGRAGAGVAPGAPPAPACVSEAVPIRIGDQVVGIVAAVTSTAAPQSGDAPAAERRAWLDAAAAAASVTALIREAHAGGAAGPAEADLLAELSTGEPDDLPAFLSRARRLGAELGSGAIAISARHGAGHSPPPLNGRVDTVAPALVSARGPGRLLGLVPLAGDGGADCAEQLIQRLGDEGWTVAVSAPRRDPAQLHHAVLEAELLGELHSGKAAPTGQEETYRLLIGVLLRDRDELQSLRERTISPLADYDARHDTDLLATLRAFLDHDGSTTETAEAMQLHRHTVGYRLSRVHEVSGLSPYESDGRERLSLGIKAHQILEAERRRGLPH